MPASAEETAALLGRVPVFDELADEDLRRVADVSVPRRFGAGEVVFREGDDSDTCYVVHAGHARSFLAMTPLGGNHVRTSIARFLVRVLG